MVEDRQRSRRDRRSREPSAPAGDRNSNAWCSGPGAEMPCVTASVKPACCRRSRH